MLTWLINSSIKPRKAFTPMVVAAWLLTFCCLLTVVMMRSKLLVRSSYLSLHKVLSARMAQEYWETWRKKINGCEYDMDTSSKESLEVFYGISLVQDH